MLKPFGFWKFFIATYGKEKSTDKFKFEVRLPF